MTPQANQLLTEALRLSDTDRGELAAQLSQSLDDAAERDVDAAWSDEIKRRLEEVRSGQVRPLSWSEARQMILDDSDSP